MSHAHPSPNQAATTGLHPVRIDKLVYGGDGLAQITEGELAGAKVFVPFSAPGDALSITIDEGKKRPFKGRIDSIVTPGPERVTPPCSVFGVCGGCQWQHLDAAAQAEWKRRIVEESMARIGKITGAPVAPIRPAPDPWRYRNKAEWFVGADRTLGYHPAQSHDIVAFDTCHIIPGLLQQAYERLASWLKQCPQAVVTSITARCNTGNDLLVILHVPENGLDNLKAEDTDALIDSLSAIPGARLQGLMAAHQQSGTALSGSTILLQTLGEQTYQVSWDSFFQVNHAQAEAMLAQTRAWLEPLGPVPHLLDVYGGVGVFALGLADCAQQVTLIESNPRAVQDAEHNARHLGVGHFKAYAGLAEQILENPDTAIADATVAILDPPRRGCHPRLLDWVSKHTESMLIYVSCDPSTLARDVQLLAAQGWRTETIEPFDLFPQTYHIETLTRLVRV